MSFLTSIHFSTQSIIEKLWLERRKFKTKYGFPSFGAQIQSHFEFARQNFGKLMEELKMSWPGDWWSTNGGFCKEVAIGNDVIRMIEAGHGEYARNQIAPRGYSEAELVRMAEEAIAQAQETTNCCARARHKLTNHVIVEVVVSEDMANLRHWDSAMPPRENRDVTVYGAEQYGPTWAVIFRNTPHPEAALRSFAPKIIRGEDLILFPSRHTGVVIKRINTKRKTVYAELIIPRKPGYEVERVSCADA